MARNGLYKSEVKKARDSLKALGKHPSVDAVRIALGNTGSKTTIHKYLTELNEEDGGIDRRNVSISEALQDLVARLASQLQDEANRQIDAVRTQQAEQARRHAEEAASLQKLIASLQDQHQRVEATLREEQATHGRTREALQSETVAHHTAEQQVIDYKERLAENEAHRRSLEEKHQHAREALEHYRSSVKEQRDQDQRRHEQQLQQVQAELRQAQQSLIVKQEDVTRLNQEGARLVAELSHVQKALYDEQTSTRRLVQQLDALPMAKQQVAILEMQLTEKEAQSNEMARMIADLRDGLKARDAQVHTLELALAAAQAKLEAQHAILSQWRLPSGSQETPMGKENDLA